MNVYVSMTNSFNKQSENKNRITHLSLELQMTKFYSGYNPRRDVTVGR